MSPDLVHIRMLLTGAAEAVAEAEAVQGAVAGTAAATEEANAASAASAGAASRSSRAASSAEKSTSRLGRAHQFLGRAALWGAGILGVGSVLALKAAYEHTQALGLATQKLSLQTGMNTRHASKWVEITQARGIQATQLTMGMSTLSKQISSANQGTATSIDLFKRWGVSLKDLKSMSTEQVIMKIADAMQHTKDVAGRAADIKTLFGRSGTNLLPLMSMGSKGLQGELGKAGGIDKDQLGQIIKTKAAMRDLGLAVQDLKNKLAVALIPIILVVVNGLRDFVEGLVQGKTWAIAIAAAIGALVAAFIALSIAAAIAWAIALGPVALVVAGIVALIAVFAVLYAKVGWFHDAVDATWGFIKTHWPILVGVVMPFLIPLLLIIKHFRTIKSVAMSVFNWIKGAAHAVGAAVSAAFNGVAGAVSSAFHAVVSAVVAAINWLIGAFNSVFDRTIDSGIPGIPVFHGFHLEPIGGGGVTGGAGGAQKSDPENQRGPSTPKSMRKSAAAIPPYEPRGGKGKGGKRAKGGDVILDKRKVGVVLHDWNADEGARA